MTCSLRTFVEPGKPRTARFRLRCDFKVTGLTLDLTREARSFSETLKLTNPDPEDGHTCERSREKQIVCTGEAGQGVRMEGKVRLRRKVCAQSPLGVKALAEGGMDCDPPGTPCLAIGYRVTRERKQPAGC